ncbi:MAG: segregation/condensation protein A [Candidatus Omnitrophica bacterium]|nr:segregation/condensation protein A [Candidatus Omnitrophota bacterium]
MSYKVKLEIFEGPLDLLLYLVKQNHLEIADLSLASITDQYLEYLEWMQALDLGVAGEFLVVAATLMQIKSRKLLPPEDVPAEEEERDPTQELIERLKEYQRFKEAAEVLSAMEKSRLVQFSRNVPPDGVPVEEMEELSEASLFDLLSAFSRLMSGQVPVDLIHEIIRDEFTVEEKTQMLRDLLRRKEKVSFTGLFQAARSRVEIVATFLALLELIRLKEALIRQSQLFGEILILKNSGSVGASA